MDSFNDAWELICSYCQNKITEVAYNTWISRIKPLRLDFDNNTAYLLVPNDFHRQTIKRCYIPLLNEAFEAIFDNKFNIDLQTPAEANIAPPVQKIIEETTDTNYEYTFDTFIVGPSNKFAHAACLAVATNPSKAYNPLFLHGNSGLGKTHLLYAIGNEIKKNDPSKVICYIKGDDFTNDMVKSIKEGKTEEFRNKHRNVDLFLVDDIQFIAGKQSTQIEFFHTFNYIYEAGHQIVITSDRPPMEMSLLDDRLRTRFEGGLMADIAPPDLETRMAIARNKATRLGLILPDDIIEYIASSITANVRQLEGVIKRLTAYKEILNSEITRASVDRAIDDVTKKGTDIPKPDNIIRETAKYYSLKPEDLKGNNRSKNTAMARQIAMYLMRQLTNLSLNDIGKELGRNHTTALSSIRKIEDLMRSDPNMTGIIRDITSNITTSSGG